MLMDCGCKWDGNLDGKLRRCNEHRRVFMYEKQIRKEARKNAREVARLTDILEEVRSHSRAVRFVVEFAEAKHPA